MNLASFEQPSLSKWRLSPGSNLVPRVFSAFETGGGSGEDPGTHSRSRVSNEDGDVFKIAATAKKGEKNWVRDANVKINKMAEKAEVRFNKK